MDLDLTQAMESHVVLKGQVRYYSKPSPDSKIQGEELLYIDCCGQVVYIRKEDAIKLPFAKTLISLVGEEIEFTIKECVPGKTKEENVYFGSMKEAYDIIKKPIIDRLDSGEVIEGKIVYLTPHGAYIGMRGVYGFLGNRDFSNDNTAVREIYNKHDKIRVKLLRYNHGDKDSIILQPEVKHIGTDAIVTFDTLELGAVYPGKVTGSFIDRIYVYIAPDCDVRCPVPKYMESIHTQDKVLVRIRNKKIYDVNKHTIYGTIINKIER